MHPSLGFRWNSCAACSRRRWRWLRPQLSDQPEDFLEQGIGRSALGAIAGVDLRHATEVDRMGGKEPVVRGVHLGPQRVGPDRGIGGRSLLDQPARQGLRGCHDARLGALSERNYSAAALKVIGDLLIPSLDRRIAATLVRISRPETSDEVLPPWPIHMTQAEIGQMANASRDRVNRALSKFEAKGWIKVEYKVITVQQLDALAAYVAEPGN